MSANASTEARFRRMAAVHVVGAVTEEGLTATEETDRALRQKAAVAPAAWRTGGLGEAGLDALRTTQRNG